ncbi:hypothetical protein KY306_01670 [Candidatus Woesearchaeota archaeon]|nr:hypothetical protein [Candidatus Woesearchaeota archaeon]
MMPSMKAMSFVKGLSKAQAETEHGAQTKKELEKSLTKVKSLAGQPGVKRSLKEELEKLEDHILKVASMEKQILNKEDMDIKDLKFQIGDLKTKLALTGAEGLKQSLDKIGFLLAELNSQVRTYSNIQTDREKRVEELEKKIKEGMETHFREITEMEKTLARLEDKYEEIRKTEKSEDEKLKLIADRINELRERLIEKRAEIVEKKKHELMVQKSQLPARPIPEPRMMFPKEEPVKHKMMFGSAPPVPKKENEFYMPPEPKKEKRGIIGWFKDLFGR